MKYKIVTIFLSIIILSFLVSCNDIINKISESATNSSANESKESEDETETVDPEISELVNKLESVSKEHLTSLDMTESMLSISEIVNTIENHSSKIDEIGSELSINSNYIKSIIFREQLLLTFEDYFADSIVESFYENPDEQESGDKDDSSTGLGQIFARTAISAENRVNNSNLDSDNIDDVKNMWYELQEDNKNIYYIGLVLKEKALNNNIDLQSLDESSVKNLFSKYNGNGEEANLYGEQTYEYFLIFEDNE
jgi:hypothetical protein